jgi:hypothetical protein
MFSEGHLHRTLWAVLSAVSFSVSGIVEKKGRRGHISIPLQHSIRPFIRVDAVREVEERGVLLLGQAIQDLLRVHVLPVGHGPTTSSHSASSQARVRNWKVAWVRWTTFSATSSRAAAGRSLNTEGSPTSLVAPPIWNILDKKNVYISH